jgi:hypothetical protein
MRRTGLRLVILLFALGLCCVLPMAGEGEATLQNVPLFDGPNGQELGWVRNPAGLKVLEERPGWRRVRLEGWIQVSPTAAIRGKAKGAPGSRLLLLPAGGSWQEAQLAAETAALQEIEPLEAEMQRLRRERARAMRADSFTEARERYDAVDTEYRSREEELHRARQRLLSEMTTALSADAAMVTYLDEEGRFELHPPGPGAYRLFLASPYAEEFPCCWLDVAMGETDLWVEMGRKTGGSKIRGGKKN